MTSSAALATDHHLLTNFEQDSDVQRLLDKRALYIIPRIAVDGSEQFFPKAVAGRSSWRFTPATT